MSLVFVDLVKLIPHGESMCLIDEVVAWDNDAIHCRSEAPAVRRNPLVDGSPVRCVILIEYAAQAAAIHAALLHSGLGDAQPAYLGAVRGVEFSADYLADDLDIQIEARCQLHSTGGAIYDIEARQADNPVLCGRLILNQPAASLTAV